MTTLVLAARSSHKVGKTHKNTLNGASLTRRGFLVRPKNSSRDSAPRLNAPVFSSAGTALAAFAFGSAALGLGSSFSAFGSAAFVKRRTNKKAAQYQRRGDERGNKTVRLSMIRQAERRERRDNGPDKHDRTSGAADRAGAKEAVAVAVAGVECYRRSSDQPFRSLTSLTSGCALLLIFITSAPLGGAPFLFRHIRHIMHGTKTGGVPSASKTGCQTRDTRVGFQAHHTREDFHADHTRGTRGGVFKQTIHGKRRRSPSRSYTGHTATTGERASWQDILTTIRYI